MTGIRSLRHRITTLLAAVVMLAGCATFQEGPTDIPIPASAAFVEVDGWKIHVKAIGDKGEPVLLLHGYSSTLFEWMRITPLLCKTHRCLLVDIPGFGWSDKKEGDYSPQHLADMMVALLEQMGISRVHVIAHSWGASVALSMALRHPERVGRLVLVGAWVYYEQLPSLMKWARVPGLGEFLFSAFFAEQPEMRYEQIYFDPDRHVGQEEIELMRRFLTRRGVVRAALQAARDQRLEEIQGIYPSIGNQALLVWGEKDLVSYPFYGKRLDEDLPDSRLVFMSRCGHVPHHEDPDGFLKLVVPFLTRGGDDAK